MVINDSEIALLKNALAHYEKRLNNYSKDEDFVKQIEKRSELFKGELESERSTAIQTIRDFPVTAPVEMYMVRNPKQKQLFEDALEQYKEDLSEIKRHIPVGLRKKVEQEIKATETLHEKVKLSTS